MVLHPTQRAMCESQTRFNIVAAGRRSGKTELIGKRRGLWELAEAMAGGKSDYRMAIGAPTRPQAKAIYWRDLIRLMPEALVASRSDSELTFIMKGGGELHVVGLDKPQRIEGQPWDLIIITEFADVKPHAWQEHLRPALADRKGNAWLEGVPEGRNHFYNMFRAAQADETGEWAAWHWTAADVMPLYLGEEGAAAELASAANDMDAEVFDQEFNASFIAFAGRAYYAFAEQANAKPLKYAEKAPLCFCFDFNVDPGVAAVVQEQSDGTCVIGEVWIPRNSNTVAVCAKLIQDWQNHSGAIRLYGDPTGGQRGSAKVAGSDWDLVKREIGNAFTDVEMRVHRGSPSVRARINAVNSRAKSGSGQRRLFVDPAKAPHVLTDLEGVQLLEGGSGELDKKRDRNLTHISDALGYYIEYEHPVRKITIPDVGGRVLTAAPSIL